MDGPTGRIMANTQRRQASGEGGNFIAVRPFALGKQQVQFDIPGARRL